MRDTTIDFQSMATLTGADFHNTCVLVLKKTGWDVLETKVKIRSVGIEIDAIANNRHGIAFPFEFKGGYGDDRPGMTRTDNISKALGNAVLFSISEISVVMAPLFVLTTVKSDKNAPAAMLRAIPRSLILDVLVVPAESKRLRQYAEMDETAIKALILRDEELRDENRRRGGWYDCFKSKLLQSPKELP